MIDPYSPFGELRLILRGHCEHEREYFLSRLGRYWYTLKALLCVILRLGDPPDDGYFYDNTITVIAYDLHRSSTPDGVSFDWSEIRVGHGIFKNWFYYHGTDGT